MVLPIYAYGQNVLKQKASEISSDYKNLKELIDDMYKTMYTAKGVGLAAPQIGKSIRLFIIDTSPFDNAEFEKETGFKVGTLKKTFINPIILKESGEIKTLEEGCLSIPNIREKIVRKSKIKITYSDENFNTFSEEYSGIIARVIQHEYDHIEGTLFTDKISPFKKKIIKNKLQNIMVGKVDVDYFMKYVK